MDLRRRHLNGAMFVQSERTALMASSYFVAPASTYSGLALYVVTFLSYFGESSKHGAYTNADGTKKLLGNIIIQQLFPTSL